MQFGKTQFILLSTAAVAAAASAGCSGDGQPCLISYGTDHEIADALVHQYNPLDTDAANYAAVPKEQQQLNIHFPTQTQNQTPEAVPNRHSSTTKRTDSSTPGTQIMSTWRQVVGGIAVAVLVAVV